MYHVQAAFQLSIPRQLVSLPILTYLFARCWPFLMQAAYFCNQTACWNTARFLAKAGEGSDSVPFQDGLSIAAFRRMTRGNRGKVDGWTTAFCCGPNPDRRVLVHCWRRATQRRLAQPCSPARYFGKDQVPAVSGCQVEGSVRATYRWRRNRPRSVPFVVVRLANLRLQRRRCGGFPPSRPIFVQ